MKKLIFVIQIALLASCSGQQLMDGVVEEKSTEFVQASDDKARIDTLVEKARWGDGQAFLQLADCYRDGICVKKDYLGMICMVEQANTFGAIDNVKDYFACLPDDNVYKQCYSFMELSGSEQRDRKDSILSLFHALDSPDALAMCGIVCVECGDTIGGFEIIGNAADNGSDFAAILQTMQNNKSDLRPDRQKLELIAEKIPVAYRLLGRICLYPGVNKKSDEKQAAYYYMKAEKHALLAQHEAAWLLSYYNDGGDIQLNTEDIKRLKAFARVPDYEMNISEPDIILMDTVVEDN